MKLLRLPVIVSFIAAFFLLSALPSYAQAPTQNGTITISPAFLDVTIEEGEEEKVISFTITNNSNDTVPIEFFPINFTQADEYGRIGFVGQDAGEYSFALSSFLLLDDSVLTLDPGEKREIPVTIQNRKDLSSGGHYAALVARIVQDQRDTVIAPAISSLILLRKKGGEQFSLSIRDTDWPRGAVEFSYDNQFSILFQNQGNVHLTPFGEVAITDLFGRILYKGVINTTSSRVMPLSRRYIPTKLTKISSSFPISLNRLSISGQDSLNEVSYVYRDSFLYIDPLFGLGVGSVLFVIILRIFARKNGLKMTKSEDKNKKRGKES